jgi:phytoene desaturase
MTSLDQRPHAIVIGAGLGGLAAAVRLGARGYRVSVLERLPTTGGRARVFRQDGFTFDAGPTIITVPFVFDELWALCGKRFADDVKLVELDPYYVIRFNDGTTFACRGDDAAMREQIDRLYPGDVPGWQRYMRESEEIYKLGFEKLAHAPFHSLPRMLGLLPDFMRLGAWRSVYQHVAARVKHEKLRMALSFHPLFVGGNPFRVTSIYSMIAHLERRYGVHAAMGGTNQIVRGMENLITGLGGQVITQADVAEITLQDGAVSGVRLADGQVMAADIVVANADPADVARTLLPASATSQKTARKLNRARFSMSLFVWYFGTKRTYDDVEHHTILMGPRYRELLNDIFERKVLADDFSLYLHRPTATDASLAPAGCDSFYVLSPVPHQDSGIDWEKAAPEYRNRIAAHLEATLLPGLRSEIVTERVFTPLDFARDYRATKGAAFGLEPVFMQSAWFRPHNKSSLARNLFFVGAGTHPGAGVPGVVSSARVLDEVVPDARHFQT